MKPSDVIIRKSSNRFKGDASGSLLKIFDKSSTKNCHFASSPLCMCILCISIYICVCSYVYFQMFTWVDPSFTCAHMCTFPYAIYIHMSACACTCTCTYLQKKIPKRFSKLQKLHLCYFLDSLLTLGLLWAFKEKVFVCFFQQQHQDSGCAWLRFGQYGKTYFFLPCHSNLLFGRNF